jgi:hypothetical protein
MGSGPWVGAAVKSDGRFTLIARTRHRKTAAPIFSTLGSSCRTPTRSNLFTFGLPLTSSFGRITPAVWVTDAKPTAPRRPGCCRQGGESIKKILKAGVTPRRLRHVPYLTRPTIVRHKATTPLKLGSNNRASN